MARVARVSQPLRQARGADLPDRLCGQPRVARSRVGHERLNARVADVLELLVIRAILIGLVRAQSGGVPANLPDFVERRVGTFETAAFRKRVTGPTILQPANRQWNRRLHRHAHIPEATMEERFVNLAPGARDVSVVVALDPFVAEE